MLDIFQKKMTLIAYLFLKLRPDKSVVTYMSKSPASDYPSKKNRVNVCELYLNLSESTRCIFIAQREGNLVAKRIF